MKKALSLILALLLCVSLLPLGALADEDISEEPTVAIEEIIEAVEETSLPMPTPEPESMSELMEEPPKDSIADDDTPVEEPIMEEKSVEEKALFTEETLPLESVEELTTDGASTGNCGENLVWFLSNDGVLTISGAGAMTDFSWNGAPWYSSDRQKIKSVIIEEGVTSIGNYAFYQCNFLVNVSIPRGLTNIGHHAFNQCTALTSITIPNSVTVIGADAFHDCSALASIVLPNNITTLPSGVFYQCSSLKSITIPDSVTVIDYAAFSYCDSLTSVVIPNSVSSIGGSAFLECTALTSITIPEGVTSIGKDAFNNCSSLKSITLPSSVTIIDEGTFTGCTSMTSITIPNSVTSIGASAFYKCKSLTSVVIPDNMTEIAADTFNSCSALSSVEIPEKVTSIGVNAFLGCTALVKLVFGGTDEDWKEVSIGSGNDPLENVREIYYLKSGEFFAWRLSNGVLTISGSIPMKDYDRHEAPWYSVSNSITSVIIEDGMTRIGRYAFYDCSHITSVEIPDSVTSIGGGAFWGCSALVNIEIPESITSISGGLFADCVALTSVTIPIAVTSIEDFAFASCTALESITIPASVTEIGLLAFGSCRSLTSITFTGSAPTIGETAFQYDVAKAYYPAHDSSWTSEVRQNYDGSIAWVGVHDYVATVIQPTCTGEGYTEHKCTRCDVSYKDNYVDALGHAWDEGIITTGATCTKTGKMMHTCTVCGETYTEEVPALGHTLGNPIRENEIAATCEKTGSYDEVVYCAVCGEELSREAKTISALGHDWNDGEVTKESTCTEPGVKSFTCSRCGETTTETIPSVGHDYKTEVTAPTCSEQGYTTHTCTRCGDRSVDSYVAALGHDYGTPSYDYNQNEGTVTATRMCSRDASHYETETAAATRTVTVGATCTTTGTAQWTAGFDNPAFLWSYTETISALGHDYTEVATAPTCTENGYTTHTCSRCGDSYIDGYVDALGHAAGEPVREKEKAATCETAGSYDEVVYCTACGAELSCKTTTIPALGHDYVCVETAATCTEAGVRTYTCKNDASHTYTEEIPAPGHAWSEWTVTTPATGNDEGVETRTCSRCGKSETRAIPMLTGEWVGTTGGYRYLLSDGSYAKSMLAEYGGKMYYLNDAGYVYTGTGWQYIDGLWYYFKSGVMVTGVQKIGGYYYFFNDDGTVFTGWLKYSGAMYFYDPDSGKLVTGLKEIKAGVYDFIDGTTRTVLDTEEGWYYFNTSTAKMYTGILKYNGSYFLYKENGALYSGWLDYGGARYYYDKDTYKLAVGWKEIPAGEYSFLNGNDVTKKNVEGGWYYFNTSTAKMYAGGDYKIGSTTYKFDDNGLCIG